LADSYALQTIRGFLTSFFMLRIKNSVRNDILTHLFEKEN
jgi:hypothetical protein